MIYLPLQVITWGIAFLYVMAGKLLAPLMVAIGMALDWPRICWPWDSFANKGRYADPHWYEQHHWSWKIHPKFAEYWWRAIRNGFSNGTRYAIKPTDPDDLWQHPDYHHGFYKGPASRAFPGVASPPKTLFRYEYDRKRWWLSRYVFTWFVSETRYFQFYAGFKFDRTEGFGISFRCWIYRNEK